LGRTAFPGGSSVSEKINGPKSQSRVFISYANQDKPFVRKLINELEKHNLSVWFDEQEIKVGDSIVAKISEGLRDSDYLVVVLSKASVTSSWVQEELNAALMNQISDKGSVVLPVLIEDCDLPPLLRSRLYADFRADFQVGLNKLLTVLKQEGESASDVTTTTTTTTPRPGDQDCFSSLSVLALADLRRRITKRMNRSEVGAIWYDTFGKKMEDDMAHRPLVDCVIELLDRAKNRDKLCEVVRGICFERPDIGNP
jgi:TIR domain